MIELTELDKLYFRAMELSDSGDFAASFPLFLQLALQGYGAAQNALALAYDRGEGVEKDKLTALKWFKKAHRTDGHTNYCGNIALTYAEIGKRRQAIYWWKKAIANGDRSDALEMAMFLIKSDEVLEFLKFAAAGEAPTNISPAGKEEAEVLLAILTRTYWD